MVGDSVQLIKEKLSIIDVVSNYVELHKAGKNLKGKSPFTNEKTPSFYVSPSRGMYYCFSSSQGGDIFTFVQKMEGVDFKGALKILAEKAGVELVPEDPKKRGEREELYAVLEEATNFFEEKLTKHTEAQKYLVNRAVSDETKKKWRIGFAPDDWRQLREYLNALGYTDEVLLKAGLVKKPDSNKQPYDVFRDRIMFPIMDTSGRVVAFSGRILKKDSELPKYVNSPETILFNKSAVLFGYDKAKHGIHKLDFSLVVEGQFDVVLSHQAGYQNAVAVSGTALTSDHVALLQRLSNRVVLALDADRAGVAAVKRAADLMLARGVDLKVAQLDNGKDPADLVKDDPKLLKQSIGKAEHVIEFLLNVLKEECKDTRVLKVRTRDEILPFVLKIQSPIERDHFANLIAKSIDMGVEAIKLELANMETRTKNKVVDTESKTNNHNEEKNLGNTDSQKNRKENLLCYLYSISELLDSKEKKRLNERLCEITGETIESLSTKLPTEIISRLTFTLEQQYLETKPVDVTAEWEDKLQQLNSMVLREKIQDLKETLKEAELNNNDITDILKEIDRLKKQLT